MVQHCEQNFICDLRPFGGKNAAMVQITDQLFYKIFCTRRSGISKTEKNKHFFCFTDSYFNTKLFVNNFHGLLYELWLFVSHRLDSSTYHWPKTCIYYVHYFSSEIFAIFWYYLKFYVINWNLIRCPEKVIKKQETVTSIFYCLSTMSIAYKGRGSVSYT